MKIVRGIGRGLCMFVVAFGVSMWLGVAMLQSTLFNRDVVKSWPREAGIYKNALNASVQVQPATQNGESKLLTQEVVAQALNSTFSPGYLQNATESFLDSAYDWLEGKNQGITFNVPIQEKRDDFTASLAAALQPQLATLPPCSGPVTASTPNCIPTGMTPDTLAQELASQATSSTTFLQAPLTEKNLGISSQNPSLPSAKAVADILFWLLPLLVTLAGVGFVLLSNSKLQGLAHLGRRLTFGAATALIIGLIILLASGSLNITGFIAASDLRQVSILQQIVDPLLRQALPDIGGALAIYSGLVVGLGLASWVIAVLVRKQRQKSTLLSPPPATPAPTQQ